MQGDIQKAAAEAAEAFRPVTESETDEGRKDNESASPAALATETVTEQQDVEEEAVPEFLRNMVLMSPTHCWGSEYGTADVEFDDAEDL
ncbi:C-repeat binding factor 1 [Sesbania bispinosa]|nr:C-repeat binding factor 1 [Sesbania bispinosa]